MVGLGSGAGGTGRLATTLETSAGGFILPSGLSGGGGPNGLSVRKSTKGGAWVTHKIPENERQMRLCTTPSTS